MRLTLSLLVVFFAGIAVGLLMAYGQTVRQRTDSRGFGFRLEAGTPQTVAKVIDGDTLELENGLHVRLLGIDAPELGRYVPEFQPQASAARDYLTQRIGTQPVRLEFTEDRIDRHGRLLAHVYLDAPPGKIAEPVDLSLAMVEAGLARAYDYRGPSDGGSLAAADPLISTLRQAEQAARSRQAGLWSLRRGDPAVEADSTGRKWVFVAAADSEVFHRADSAAAKALPADKLVGFPDRDTALQSGRRDAGQLPGSNPGNP